MRKIKKTFLALVVLSVITIGCNKEESTDSSKSTIQFNINGQQWKCTDGVAAITKVNDDAYIIMLNGKVKDYFESKDSDFLFSIEKENPVSTGTYTGSEDGGQVSVSYIEGYTYYGTIPVVSPDADFWITIQEIETSSSPINNRIKGTFGGTLKRNVGMDILTLPISNGEFYWN